MKFSYLLKIKALSASGDFEKALNECQTLIKLCPNLSIAYYFASQIFDFQGMGEEAVKFIKKAIEVNDNYGFYWGTLAYFLFKKDDFKSSIDAWTKSIDLEPSSYLYYNNLGYVFAQLNDYNQAEVNYHKSVELSSFQCYSYYNLAEIKMRQNKEDEAENFYAKAISLNNNLVTNPDGKWLFYLPALINKEFLEKHHILKIFKLRKFYFDSKTSIKSRIYLGINLKSEFSVEGDVLLSSIKDPWNKLSGILDLNRAGAYVPLFVANGDDLQNVYLYSTNTFVYLYLINTENGDLRRWSISSQGEYQIQCNFYELTNYECVNIIIPALKSFRALFETPGVMFALARTFFKIGDEHEGAKIWAYIQSVVDKSTKDRLSNILNTDKEKYVIYGAFSQIQLKEYDRAIDSYRSYFEESFFDKIDLYKGLFLDVLFILEKQESELNEVESLIKLKPDSPDLFIRKFLLLGKLNPEKALEFALNYQNQEILREPAIAYEVASSYLWIGNYKHAQAVISNSLTKTSDLQNLLNLITEEQHHIYKAQTYSQGLSNHNNGVRKKSKVALMFSGFVRDIDSYKKIYSFIEKNKDFEIHIFCHLFDRLGNLRVPHNMPKETYDYIHGGFYREIMKTRLVTQQRFLDLFQPQKYVCEERLVDDFYIKKIGLAHPQWYKVYLCFKLVQEFSKENDIDYDILIRTRFEWDMSEIDLKSLQVKTGEVITPSESIYGYENFKLCDKFALGDYETMSKYCEVGFEKNFVNLELEPGWKKEWKGSHETHLAYWLCKNNIKVVYSFLGKC